MKYKAFTLAEVLITLSIVGIIATLTLPALMTNISERQFISGLKKSVNTIKTIGDMNLVKNGFSYSGVTTSDKTKIYDEGGNLVQSLYAIFMANGANPKYLTTKEMNTSGGLADGGIRFNDSTIVMISSFTSTSPTVIVTVDVNGTKGPNLLSNCNGSKADKGSMNVTNIMAAAMYINSTGPSNLDKCDDPKNRVIKDRFVLYLTDNGVYPLEGAAAWAMKQ